MASYSKQMMEIAKEWLAENPDPKSPFIKVPGIGKMRAESLRRVDFDRYERAALIRPEIRPLLKQLRTNYKETQESEVAVHEAEKELEKYVNHAPGEHHDKYNNDNNYRADIGRWVMAWARHGYNTFDLSADFVAAMLLTDARELDISEVRLPFGGVLMLIPDGFARGVEGLSYTKIHITEIRRNEHAQLEVGGQLIDILDKLTIEQAQKVVTDSEKKLKDEPPSLLTRLANEEPMLHIYATDGAHVLDTYVDRKDLSWSSFDDLPDHVEDADDRRARHTLRQIVFGTLAYMGAVKDAAERVAPESPKKRAAKEEPSVVRWTVGRTIRINPELVRSVRAGAREVAFRLKHRHIVRGHYRNQAHGPRRAERTRIWIMPFWKGPEAGAELVHTYLFDDKKSEDNHG